MSPVQDTFAQRSREKKARLIVAEVIRQALETLGGLDDSEWIQLCRAAGANAYKAPSDESKKLVYQLLREKM